MPDTEEKVFCQHCPEVLEQDQVGRWRDNEGYYACQRGAVIGSGVPCAHTPMPAGLRGSAV